MLVSSLILIVIFSTNGLPYSLQTDTAYRNPEQQAAILQTPEQQIIFQLAERQRVLQPPEQQEVIFQPEVEQHGVLLGNSRQEVMPESPEQRNTDNFDDFAADGSQVAEHDNDFTISCTGLNRICTSKKDCVNGYVHLGKNAIYPSSIKAQQCRIHDQVCCTIAKELEGELKAKFGENVKNNFNNINYQTGQTNENYNQVAELNKEGDEPNNFGSSIQSGFAIPTHIQVGCAAALLCVEEKFCTIDGTISPEPVLLTEKQLLRRVPMSSCKNPDNGIIGKCCRDPNYVDPWPTGNLPANYSGGFDEQGFPTFMNIVKVKLPVKAAKVPVKSPANVEIAKEVEPVLIEGNSDISSKKIYLVPPTTGEDDRSVPNASELKLKCGIRNKALQQSEVEDIKTIFAEIPWQAMVLHLKEKKILCSAVLLGPEDVLTAANCVDNLSPMDVSIKLGEWKLGYELRHEEPLAFQIINVSSVSLHPDYKGKSGDYDLAMLHLENPVTFDLHINPLCLPKSKHSLQKNKLCITTGWGKSILQAHYAGAIMHAISMDILSTDRCKELLLNTDFGVDIADRILCATPKEEKNNVCDTDIGGPLACQNEDGSYELAGIYSQDTGCYPSNQVAMFAPLDLGWLKNIMSNVTVEESHNVNNEPYISSNDYRKSTLDTDNQYLPPN